MTEEEKKAKRREYDKKRWAQIKADPAWAEKERQRHRDWRTKNPDYERDRSRRRYRENPQPWNEKSARWFREHRDWDNERHRRLHWENQEHENHRVLLHKHKAWVSPEQLRELWPRLRNGPCEICGATRNGIRKRFCIDHDHVTQKFRGVLCHNCNMALGQFGDSEERLKQAIDYLVRKRATVEGAN